MQYNTRENCGKTEVICMIYLLLSIKSDTGMHLRPVPKTIRKDVRSTVTRRPEKKETKHIQISLFFLSKSNSNLRINIFFIQNYVIFQYYGFSL
jgi:hypothetical protein